MAEFTDIQNKNNDKPAISAANLPLVHWDPVHVWLTHP